MANIRLESLSENQIYIEELIKRFLSKEDQEPQENGVFDSSKTISWKAHREAEKLIDEKLIPILVSRIEKEPNKKIRDAAYFILGHIGKNTKNVSVAQFLIDRQFIEKDKHLVATILDRIAKIPKPLGINIAKLIEATRDNRWLVRHSAINSLNYSADTKAEDRLIEISSESDDPYDIIYANAVLNEIGTSRAIPVLQEHLNSRKRDIKISAELAIEEIGKRES